MKQLLVLIFTVVLALSVHDTEVAVHSTMISPLQTMNHFQGKIVLKPGSFVLHSQSAAGDNLNTVKDGLAICVSDRTVDTEIRKKTRFIIL